MWGGAKTAGVGCRYREMDGPGDGWTFGPNSAGFSVLIPASGRQPMAEDCTALSPQNAVGNVRSMCEVELSTDRRHAP